MNVWTHLAVCAINSFQNVSRKGKDLLLHVPSSHVREAQRIPELPKRLWYASHDCAHEKQE
eukprot:1523081-Amphidinium_carterae.1